MVASFQINRTNLELRVRIFYIVEESWEYFWSKNFKFANIKQALLKITQNFFLLKKLNNSKGDLFSPK